MHGIEETYDNWFAWLNILIQRIITTSFWKILKVEPLHLDYLLAPILCDIPFSVASKWLEWQCHAY
jgi:hypothetical protein